MLTVDDLVRDLGVRLVAGAPGAGHAVRWVHLSELLDPTPWLSGGELLLTTGLQLAEPSEQEQYVARLARHGLAGLGLGTGFEHATVPEALRAAAEEHGFPLFEVPYELPFIAVTEKAFTHIVNEQYAVLERAIATHERLERIVLSERGLDALAAALATLIEGVAVIFDARGGVLAVEGRRRDEPAVGALAAELREHARRGAAGYAPAVEPGGHALALPVARAPGANGGSAPPEAWLVAVRAGGALTDFDRLMLHQAVTIVALELLRRRVAHETERRLAGDILSAVVSGELAGEELARRLAPFGLGDRVGVLVLAPEPSRRDRVEAALAAVLSEEGGRGMAAGLPARSSAPAMTCALVAAPRGGEDELFALAERLRSRASRSTGSELAAGVGRPAPAGELRRSFHEARCALEARAFAAEPASGANGDATRLVATYRDLGSFQLLLSLQDDDALRLFCDSILSPIEDGEGAYGGELMRSLETFIECNGQWERAARRLYCHRHTLRYRIRRVEELTGRSLDSARDRIEFWLALRGRELVS